MKGRKCKQESRATEFRQRLLAWKQMPEPSRPSLRGFARELNTTHQLLAHYLAGLEEWRWVKDLEQFRANAKAKGIPLTPALEKRYLAWLRKIEARRVREDAKAATWARKNPHVIDWLKKTLGAENLPDSMKVAH